MCCLDYELLCFDCAPSARTHTHNLAIPFSVVRLRFKPGLCSPRTQWMSVIRAANWWCIFTANTFAREHINFFLYITQFVLFLDASMHRKFTQLDCSLICTRDRTSRFTFQWILFISYPFLFRFVYFVCCSALVRASISICHQSDFCAHYAVSACTPKSISHEWSLCKRVRKLYVSFSNCIKLTITIKPNSSRCEIFLPTPLLLSNVVWMLFKLFFVRLLIASSLRCRDFSCLTKIPLCTENYQRNTV